MNFITKLYVISLLSLLGLQIFSSEQEFIHANRTKTVHHFDQYGNNISRTEFDVYGRMTMEFKLNSDGTQIRIIYNNDNSQIIDYFDQCRKNSSRVETDRYGKPKKSVTFNEDNTQTIQQYNPDKTQLIHHRDMHGHIISTTHVDSYGIQHFASTQLMTAWHEAGHALSHIHNDSLTLIQRVSIQPNRATNTQGHVQSIQAYQSEESIEELENQIISLLCGGVAEQVLLCQNLIFNQSEIMTYFSQPQYRTDMHMAYKKAREVIMKNTMILPEKYILQKIDETIARLYKKAYQFIVMHKQEVKKIADELMKKGILSSDETYNLVHADKPLLYFEQGPLSISDIENYLHRKHKNH